ncbi:MAG: OsmC family protein [Alphaproteobacteria bacterium]
MAKEHHYTVAVEWTGNQGTGTSHYRAFSRDHEIRVEGRPPIAGSSDPAFRGDPSRWNPEDMLVGSLSACHMLWYLHLAAVNGIVVTRYLDRAEGVMSEGGDGGGRFLSVTLKPEITVKRGADLATAEKLHHVANEKCFIANSVNFPVTHEARFVEED